MSFPIKGPDIIRPSLCFYTLLLAFERLVVILPFPYLPMCRILANCIIPSIQHKKQDRDHVHVEYSMQRDLVQSHQTLQKVAG